MTQALLDALRSLAKAAHYRDPDQILAEQEARRPQPKPFWWVRP